MRTTFHALMDEMLSEIVRRDESYASLFPLPRLSPERAVGKYAALVRRAGAAAGDLERALAEGFEHLAKSWPAGTVASDGADPLGEVVCQGIVDAVCADEGALPLVAGAPAPPAAETLASAYDERRLPDGRRYFVRRRGTKPLFLVNAAGVPIDIWRRFLGDGAHDLKVVVAERASGDLFAGGLERNVEIAAEAEGFAAILDQERLEGAGLLAWCNGARVAIELARRCTARISSLVLVAPTLRTRIEGAEPKPCPFEIGLHPVLEAVAARPELAPVLAQTISQQTQAADWSALAANPARRAEALFRLPPKDIAPGLMAPLATGSSLLTLARQVPADEAYPIADRLTQLSVPVGLILGRHDQIVSNAFTLSLMQHLKRPPRQAVIAGSGHYLHDLQYPYFRLLLGALLEDREPPPAARFAPSWPEAKPRTATGREAGIAAGA